MAWALASGIAGNNAENKERNYQQEQSCIDLELLQIKSDAANGVITPEVAQIRTEQWVTNNHTRLKKQAALAAELDKISPLADGSIGKANGDTPFPAGTPQAALYWKWEEAETLAMAKFPKQASPEERQRLTDLWAKGSEGAKILGEKRKLLAQENQRRSALLPPAPPPAPAGASAAKAAQANLASRRHAFLQEIYTRHANATPEELQILIDQEHDKFEALNAESAAINLEVIKEDIAAEIKALMAVAADPASTPAPSLTPLKK